MIRYFIKRIFLLIPVVLGVITLIFLINSFTPGDPATQILGTGATEEEKEVLRESLGLNDPFLVQYFNYLKGIVTEGSLGISYQTRQPVAREIATRFPTTLKLATFCTIYSLCIGVPLGIISAVKRYTWVDTFSSSFALAAVSIPSFWLGTMLIMLFSVKLRVLPSFGIEKASGWILPTVSLSLMSVASLTRTTRSAMLDYINGDFVKTARAKGQKESVVIWKHMFGNALIPIVTVAGSTFATLLGGAVMMEQVFAIPGLGKYMVDAIKANNYPAVQGGVLYLSIVTSIVNLIIDLLYAVIDPRVKANFKKSAAKKKAVKVQNVPEGGKA